MNINELLKSDDLRHILRDPDLTTRILGDIEYLVEAGFINLQGDIETGTLRIKSKGSEALDLILESYEQYLKQQSDPILQYQYRHVSSLPDNIKRPEIYRYATEKYGANFRKFLEKTRIFEKFGQITVINQDKPDDVSRWTEEVIALSNQPLETRIKEREDGRMEMKSSFRYDMTIQGPNKKLEKESSIAISGFMNGQGGILTIGVDPTGKPVGISKDYYWVQNKNADGFERELRNSIEKYLKKKIADVLVNVRFDLIGGQPVCEVIVRPSRKPIVLYDGDMEEFYVRIGNSTKLYRASAMIEYCQGRFKTS